MERVQSIDYWSSRPEIKSGDLLVWSRQRIETPADLIPFTVRFFTLSDYNHTGVAWRANGRLFVIEATLPEIRIQPLSKRRPVYYIPMDIKFTKSSEKWLLSKIGIDYSVMQAVAAYLNKDIPGKYICTKFTGEFYRNHGIDLDPTKLTPSDHVRDVLEKTGAPMFLLK